VVYWNQDKGRIGRIDGLFAVLPGAGEGVLIDANPAHQQESLSSEALQGIEEHDSNHQFLRELAENS